ncbi:MAG: hypothetical protein ABII27_01925 [bacterium]
MYNGWLLLPEIVAQPIARTGTIKLRLSRKVSELACYDLANEFCGILWHNCSLFRNHRPQYVFINGLPIEYIFAYGPYTPAEGDSIIISFDKITNHAFTKNLTKRNKFSLFINKLSKVLSKSS